MSAVGHPLRLTQAAPVSAVGRLLRLARADVLERTRSFGFLVVLAASVYAGHAFLPPNHASYATFRLDQYRGVYNSAWVGALEALLTGVFLSLVGFYLVRSAIDRDRRTRVGEILAASPLGRVAYTLGKTLSNFAVLASMATVVAISAGVAQVLRGEDTHVALGPLLAPFLFLTLPVLLLVSATAVLFEATPGLRGGFGSVVYFFLSPLVFALSVGAHVTSSPPGNDLLGIRLVLPSMIAACRAAYPNADLDKFAMGINVRDKGTWSLTTFTWHGIEWTPGLIAGRLLWVIAALAIAALAALPFDRFDPARVGGRVREARGRRGASRGAPTLHAGDSGHPGHLTPLDPVARAGSLGGRFAAVVAAELKLTLRAQPRAWFLGWLVLAALALALPLDVARGRLLPLLWIWPITMWSPLGTREKRHGTDGILFAAPHPLGLQLAGQWTAALLATLAVGFPIALRFALAADLGALAAWAVGGAFIPALALALGTWSGHPRTFEALYLFLWYVGPLQPIASLDFMGASRAAVERGTTDTFALATAALLVLATLGRRRQLLN